MIHTFVAMLLFAFFAITGMIVDVGYARLTQRQMAQATDAGSIEGVRLRDTVAGSFTETQWRDAVSAVVEYHFDDDFQATAADTRQYGAGPLIELGPGMTSIGANRQVLVDPDEPVFKPVVEWNTGNAQHGDLVGGIYDAGDMVHVESPAYQRTDFAPGSAMLYDDPTDRSLGAFLVRLRRTRNESGLDQIPGVSSGGPALPYIFGQGSLMATETKERGITVRATGIAGARRVTLVGLPYIPAQLPGATPFVLDVGYWNSMVAGQTMRLRLRGNGTILGTPRTDLLRDEQGNPVASQGAPIPFFPWTYVGGPTLWAQPWWYEGPYNSDVVGALSYRGDPARNSWSIGDPVSTVPLSWSVLMDWLGHPDHPSYDPHVIYFYVPLVSGSPTRVVGFGSVAVGEAAQFGFSAHDFDFRPEIIIVKLPSYVAPTNASAIETPGLAGVPAATIMPSFRTVDEPLRAAALVR